MKTLKPTLLAVTLIVMVSSTALAGNIGGLRTTGNIGGMRSAGNIGGMRGAGAPRIGTVPSITPGSLRFESAFSGMLTGLIRMLFESGALL